MMHRGCNNSPGTCYHQGSPFCFCSEPDHSRFGRRATLAVAVLLLPATVWVLLLNLLLLLLPGIVPMELFATEEPAVPHAVHLTIVELAAVGPVAGGADWQQQQPCGPAERFDAASSW
jgi:hypothetical protein